MCSNIHIQKSERLKKSFHIIVKPIGSTCNLTCDYCYYLYKEDLLHDKVTGHIDNELLEAFIRHYIAEQDVEIIHFSWHGGEPTLAGLDFYRKIIEIQNKYIENKTIINDLQTNGLLLDDDWCQFFKQHNFVIGISLDGPKNLHDRYRKNKGGSPSFDQVYKATRLLRKYEIVFNTLTVVNAANARYPREVYEFLTKDIGATRLQWLPCVEPQNYVTTAPGSWDAAKLPATGTNAAKPTFPDSFVTDWSVDPEDWGEFLCRTFDLWLNHDYGKVSVNWFESLIGQWMQGPPQLCTLGELCGRSLVIEKDGSLYSCDHFVYPEYKIGHLNGNNQGLSNIVYSPRQRKFGCNKRDTLTDYCKQCEYRFACNGDCPKNRFVKTPDGQPGLSYLCPGLKRFFTHADPYLRQIVAQLPSTFTTRPWC